MADQDNDSYSSEDSLMPENEDTASEKSEDMSNDEIVNSKDGNSGWADAMGSILKSTVSTDNFMLSKAKKDSEVRKKLEEEGKTFEVELVPTDSSKDTEKSTTKPSTNNKKIERKCHKADLMKKKLWENMCRVKADVTQKQAEKTLSRIATRGVVQLFNAVKEQQKRVETKLKETGDTETKREKVLKTYNKGAFLDLLKNKEPKENKIEEKMKVDDNDNNTNSGWSVLRDDFMMGASMKDWDKEDNET